MTQPEPGSTARDAEADETKNVFITNVYDTPADEEVIDYTYDKSPITVYTYEGPDGNQPNKNYPADDSVVGVVYIETLKETGHFPEMDLEEIRADIESGPLTEYKFPVSRLQPARN